MVTAVRFLDGQEALSIDYSGSKYARFTPRIAVAPKALFRVVENSDFLNHLRNGHLEKSVVTGIFRALRSPETAKTPRKVHLRLRFQNPGKPRTAGLCGRAAGACDRGPLSCAKIERPSPLEKPSCKVRFFAQTHSHEYRQKVTATTLFQTTSHRTFSTSPTTGLRSLSRVKVGTHSALGERSHTAACTPKQGAFRMGVVSLLSERSARSPTSPGRVSERQVLPLLGLGRGCSQRTQKAFGTAMRLCASLF